MSTRTMIVLSALSDTTMPWRTFGRPGPCSGACCSSTTGAAARASARLAFCLRAVGAALARRCAPVRLALGEALLEGARTARPAWPWPRERRRCAPCGWPSGAAGFSSEAARFGGRLRGGHLLHVLSCLFGFSHQFFCGRVDAALARDGQGASEVALGGAAGPAVFSSSPVACWRRRPNRLAPLRSRCARADPCRCRSRSSVAFITDRPLAARTWSSRAACDRPGAWPRERGAPARRRARTSRGPA